MKKQAVLTSKAPGAIGPYSQAIRSGNLLFVSGQIPLDCLKRGTHSQRNFGRDKKSNRNLKAIIEAAAGH